MRNENIFMKAYYKKSKKKEKRWKESNFMAAKRTWFSMTTTELF
jgi:hypothetical protein